MKKIITEIIIDKDVSTVWKVLTDFDNYATWNPFVKSVQGEKSVGNKVTVTCELSSGKKVKFKPVVINFDRDKEFRWKGKAGIRGIFDGQHYFKLEKLSKNQTKFIHGEKMGGIFVSLMMGSSSLNKMTKLFKSMNEALKKECEENR